MLKKEFPAVITGSFNIGIKDFRLTDYFGFLHFDILLRRPFAKQYLCFAEGPLHTSFFLPYKEMWEERYSVSGQRGMLEDYTGNRVHCMNISRGVPLKKIHWKATPSKG